MRREALGRDGEGSRAGATIRCRSVEAAGWGSGSSVGGLSQPQETKKVEKATGWAGAGNGRLFAAGAAVVSAVRRWREGLGCVCLGREESRGGR